jgi:alanine racemase
MNESLPHSATPEDLAGAVLTVDLAAVKDNWRLLAREAGRAECGAAVKGDAYGLGIAPIAKALWQAGCRSFFVARPKEGEELRFHLPEAVI